MSLPTRPEIGGIHHLKLPVTDLERSVRWYSDVLGARRLTELDHRRPDGALFAVILDVPNPRWTGGSSTSTASASWITGSGQGTSLPRR
jgi:catechol 2,3-dioxygenase-like lactoylglutathione lyase family enzyme